LADKRIGPLEGFRSKAGWPFVAELALVFSEDDKNWKLEFDFGDDKNNEETGELVDFSASTPLGACPKCGSPVHAHGSNYVCSQAVPTAERPLPTCDFKSGQVILQQAIEPEQMAKLLATGKTDLLDKFVSNKTRRAFKAFLAWDAQAGKVGFEFEPRESKYPARKTAAKPAAKAPAKKAARKTPARKKAA
jgi:DNA topoisomerase-3